MTSALWLLVALQSAAPPDVTAQVDRARVPAGEELTHLLRDDLHWCYGCHHERLIGMLCVQGACDAALIVFASSAAMTIVGCASRSPAARR